MRIIHVDQPSFLINLDNFKLVYPNKTEHNNFSNNTKRLSVQSYRNGCPTPKEGEILYRYTAYRGCIINTQDYKKETINQKSLTLTEALCITSCSSLTQTEKELYDRANDLIRKEAEKLNLEYQSSKRKRYVLTDFNTERWNGTNMQTVKTAIENLNNKHTNIYGEIGNPTTFDVSLNNVSHTISNLEFNNDGKVYGDVEFLDNDRGKRAKELIKLGCRFGIRMNGSDDTWKGGKITVNTIFTWDIIL